MNAVASRAVSGGFKDPVFDGQAVFRAMMGVFAEPGTIADLSGRVEAPDGLVPGAAALLAALSDADAPVHLDEPMGDAPAWLAFQTGSAPVGSWREAAFVVLAFGSDPAGWDRFPQGTEPYPDRSATLILPVEALEGGPELVLTGPGIQSRRRIAPRGLSAGFVEYRRRNAALFPRGHDLVLVAGTRVMALPRTTRVAKA